MANDEQFAERIKHPERFLRLPEVKTRTGLARSTIYLLWRKAGFRSRSTSRRRSLSGSNPKCKTGSAKKSLPRPAK
jgi:hypothetical protein